MSGSSAAASLDVLIVDDDDLVCARTEKLLETRGVGCLSVHSLAQAREAMKAVCFPLLILDRRLKDGDGLDLCREYRTLYARRGVSILVYSAMDAPQQVVATLAAGADAHLTKGCGDAELLQKIDELLANLRESRKASERSSAEREELKIPFEEVSRVRALHAYSVLDTLAEEAFDDITLLAASACNAPIAVVSLVDIDRQWLKSPSSLRLAQAHKESAFHALTLARPDNLLVVADARSDARFANDSLVVGEPHARFYAGAPLVTPDGRAIGTVGVMDTSPREMNARERQALLALARQAMVLLEQRAAKVAMEEAIQARMAADVDLKMSEALFREAFENAPIGIALVSTEGAWLRVNRALCQIVGYSPGELLRTTFQAITHPDDLQKDLEFVQQVLSGTIASYEMEKRYFHKSGQVVWVLLSVSLVRTDNGYPAFFVSQIQDISHRRR